VTNALAYKTAASITKCECFIKQVSIVKSRTELKINFSSFFTKMKFEKFSFHKMDKVGKTFFSPKILNE